MTYSKEIFQEFNKKNIKIGDRVVAGKYEGLLMPSPEITSSPTHLILKLDNGYNVGIKYEQGMKIEKSKTPEPESISKEYNYETTDAHVSEVKDDIPGVLLSVLSVGGTISSKVDYRTGAVNAKMNAKDLVAQIPELVEIADFKMRSIADAMSEDMDHTHWQLMAKEVAKELEDTEGVIITHGTDTMHYSSAALSFMLPDLKKPVIFTGAQRSSDRGSADSALNLICSAHAAKSDIAGVSICMHGEPNDSYCLLIRGTKARKFHATMRNAFRPVNDYPLAKIWSDGKIEETNENIVPRTKSKVTPDTKYEPRMALLKAHPDSNPKVVDFLVNKECKGIVLEGTGLGHVPTQARMSWIPSIKAAVERDVPVVVTTQTIYGRINPNVYSNLRTLYHEAGAIPAGDMLTETAFVKLGWVLGHTKDIKKVREMMLTNYAGELNERLEPEMFLY